MPCVLLHYLSQFVGRLGIILFLVRFDETCTVRKGFMWIRQLIGTIQTWAKIVR